MQDGWKYQFDAKNIYTYLPRMDGVLVTAEDKHVFFFPSCPPADEGKINLNYAHHTSTHFHTRRASI